MSARRVSGAAARQPRYLYEAIGVVEGSIFSIVGQPERLAILRSDAHLTADQFETAKAQLLGAASSLVFLDPAD